MQSIAEVPVENRTGRVWHVCVQGLPANCLYAYKVFRPDAFDTESHTLLLDPYAKIVASPIQWGMRDEAASYRPLGVVDTSTPFDWQGILPPETDFKDLIIYEMHVRGFTHDPSSAVSNPASFLGVIEKIPYLTALGVNAVKLLPVQEFNENENPRVNPETQAPLHNYWGYSTVNFFAPMNRYSCGDACGASSFEFKTMVRELHRAGIKVILDIVFNHTAEGVREGQVYAFKGLDPSVYYLTDTQGKFIDLTGCGNTVNCNHPVVSELIISCLRHWVVDRHVDGFRFDLASIFYRGKKGEPLPRSPLVEAMSQDPVLANAMLIAEPWDAAGMYQVGGYYPDEQRWSEWNGKYRDTIRRFIKGDSGEKRQFSKRLCGSQDLYGSGRSPLSSINFVTAHDGFTLADLVAYNSKHNLNNGEDNKDGLNENDSWNCGEEGPTDSKKIDSIRERQKRNFILGLMLSQGVPMIQMGDEYGHTRQGNNNSYCQDNALNWFLWDELEKNKGFFRFYKNMIHFRKNHPILRQGKFLTDVDISWHGHMAADPDWDGDTQFLAFAIKDHTNNDDIFAAFNVHHESVYFEIPDPPPHKAWRLIVNTSNDAPLDFFDEMQAEEVGYGRFKIQPHSAILLKATDLPSSS